VAADSGVDFELVDSSCLPLVEDFKGSCTKVQDQGATLGLGPDLEGL
jgi:hypothetical protein